MLHLHQTDVAAVLSSNLHVIILQQIHTADLAAMHAETKPVGTADTTIGRHVLQVKITHTVYNLWQLFNYYYLNINYYFGINTFNHQIVS